MRACSIASRIAFDNGAIAVDIATLRFALPCNHTHAYEATRPGKYTTTHTHACAHTHTHTRVQVCTHTHTHTHTHTSGMCLSTAVAAPLVPTLQALVECASVSSEAKIVLTAHQVEGACIERSRPKWNHCRMETSELLWTEKLAIDLNPSTLTLTLTLAYIHSWTVTLTFTLTSGHAHIDFGVAEMPVHSYLHVHACVYR